MFSNNIVIYEILGEIINRLINFNWENFIICTLI